MPESIGLDNAIKHALEVAECTPDNKCASEHHQLANYLKELKEFRQSLKVPQEQAEKIVDWISRQKYGDEELLHPAVCCDFVGRQRFIKSIAGIIEGI